MRGINEIINGNCLDYMQLKVDIVITDPPYPNYKHFIDGIEDAKRFLSTFNCDRFMVFWDEMSEPPVQLPCVAKHVWHRTNTNRPDNYEMIYEYHKDGAKRASRVLRHPVVYPGLTGCVEATGHPTQKPVSLIRELLRISGIIKSGGIVLDPFAGSGTLAVACQIDRVPFYCIEKEQIFVSDAMRRLSAEKAKLNLFADATLKNIDSLQTAYNTPCMPLPQQGEMDL